MPLAGHAPPLLIALLFIMPALASKCLTVKATRCGMSFLCAICAAIAAIAAKTVCLCVESLPVRLFNKTTHFSLLLPACLHALQVDGASSVQKPLAG